MASGGSYVSYSRNYVSSAGKYTVGVSTDSNYTFPSGSTYTTISCYVAPPSKGPNGFPSAILSNLCSTHGGSGSVDGCDCSTTKSTSSYTYYRKTEWEWNCFE